MHHDGMYFFPLPYGSTNSDRGLLVMNHEYVDHGLLFRDATANWSADKVRKSQAAHGVSVIEIAFQGGNWEVVRPSQYGRRITAYTPMRISGPAAGDPALRTAADPAGTTVLGTVNNCANGFTPWGTYLTCEENWNGYFVYRTHAHPREPGALRDHRHRLRLPLARVRRALGLRRPPERAQPLRLGGGDRSLRPQPHAGEAHRPRPHQARGSVADGGPGRARRHLHGRRRAVRVRLQVRHPRCLEPVEPGRQHQPAGQRDALRRPVQRGRRGPLDPARLRRERPRCRRGLHEPGRRAHPHPPGGGPRGRDAHGPSGVDHGDAEHARRLPDPHQQHRARSRGAAGHRCREPAGRQHVRPHRALDGRRRATRPPPPSGGASSFRRAIEPTPTRPSAATSRATRSAPRTASGRTAAACSGSRPTSRPARWAPATT